MGAASAGRARATAAARRLARAASGRWGMRAAGGISWPGASAGVGAAMLGRARRRWPAGGRDDDGGARPSGGIDGLGGDALQRREARAERRERRRRGRGGEVVRRKARGRIGRERHVLGGHLLRRDGRLRGRGARRPRHRARSRRRARGAARRVWIRSRTVFLTKVATRTGGGSFMPATRRISAARAAAEGKRLLGSADRARAATSASGAAQGLAGGTVARTVRPLRSAVTMADGCVFGKSDRPVSASQRMTPAL